MSSLLPLLTSSFPLIIGAMLRLSPVFRSGPSHKSVLSNQELLNAATGATRERLQNLMDDEIQALTTQERERLEREIDWGTVAAVAVLAPAFTVVTYFLAWRWGHWYGIALAGVAALLGIAIIVAGSADLYKKPDSDLQTSES